MNSSARISSPVRRHPVFHSLRVSRVDRLTAEAVAVTFDVPDDLREAYAFRAGQHVTLRMHIHGKEIRRSYSLCSPEGGELRIAVKRLFHGVFSPHILDAVQPGQSIDVLTPIGHFTTAFDPSRTRHYAAIAAGSGITPIFSLLTTALAVEPKSSFTLVYGNQSASSTMFLDELADVKDRYLDRFQLVHVFSREEGTVELLSGRLTTSRVAALLDSLMTPEAIDEWFLCGPMGMVTEAQKALSEAGVPSDRVRTELFYAGEAPSSPEEDNDSRKASDSDVTIVLDGRATHISMARSERILDAALKVRSELPFACKGGVCATCRAKVVSGEVRMERNFSLDADELANGYVLTCQAHPVSESIVVDFDA